MSKVQKTSVLPVPRQAQFSEEDWFVINEVLNRVARALRKIEREQRQQGAQETTDQQPNAPPTLPS